MKLRDVAKKTLQKFERTPEKQGGFIGRADGTIRVPGKSRYIYVRLGKGSVVEAYNENIQSPGFGLAVEIVHRHGEYYAQARQVYSEIVPTGTPAGTESDLQWPGARTLYIRPEQFLPGLVYPKSGMIVILFGGTLPLPGGGYITIPGQEIDLSAHVPASGAEWAVVSLETDGSVSVTTGGPAATWSALDEADIPASTGFQAAAVRLYAGQTSIQHGKFGSMIKDLRFFQSAGGGAIILPANIVPATEADGTVSDNSPVWIENDLRAEIGPAQTIVISDGVSGWLIKGNEKIPAVTILRGGGAGGVYLGRVQGEVGDPLPIVSGNNLGFIAFGGATETDEFDAATALINARATENYNTGARGTKIEVGVTGEGENSRTPVFEFKKQFNESLQWLKALTWPADMYDKEVATAEWIRKWDWWNNVVSAARLYGGEISSNGDGTVRVEEGVCLLKTTNVGPETIPTSINAGQAATISPNAWSVASSLALTDAALNYIYYDGSIKATTTPSSISFTEAILLGLAYRSGTTVTIRNRGNDAWNHARRIELAGDELFRIVRGTGMILSAVGTRGIAVTAGTMWAGLANRHSVAAFSTASAGQFTTWHGATSTWTATTGQTQVDNTKYDDGSTTLATIADARYGVRWVYELHNGSVHVVYGRGSYQLAAAQSAQPPASLPGLLSAYGVLIGKIIILKSATAFYSLELPDEKNPHISTPTIDAGTWTPTLTNTTNITASVAYECTYQRIGNIVSFAGLVEINATALGNVVLKMSLPIASNLAVTNDASGNITSAGAAQVSGSIIPDVAADTLDFRFYAAAAGNVFYRFAGQYVIK